MKVILKPTRYILFQDKEARDILQQRVNKLETLLRGPIFKDRPKFGGAGIDVTKLHPLSLSHKTGQAERTRPQKVAFPGLQ